MLYSVLQAAGAEPRARPDEKSALFLLLRTGKPGRSSSRRNTSVAVTTIGADRVAADKVEAY